MATEEELRRMLAQRDAEAAELQQQLAQAATLGQELIAQNEALNVQLVKQKMDAGGTSVVLTGTGDAVARPHLSVPSFQRDVVLGDSDKESASGSARGSPRESWQGLRGPALSTVSEPLGKSRQATRSRLGTWEDWMAEKSLLEEEHALLRRKCVQLEKDLCEQQQAVRARAGSDVRSRAGSMALPSLPENIPRRSRVGAGIALGRTQAEEDEEQQKSELEVLKQAHSQDQDHVEELQSKLRESDQRVQILNMSLEQKTAELLKENTKYKEMVDEMQETQMQAVKTIKEHEQAKELEAMRKSVSMMHDNIENLSRRTSKVGQSLGGMTHTKSLFDEVDDNRDVDHLEQENEELLKAVLELREKLDQAEKQIEVMGEEPTQAEAKLQSGGDAAAGGAAVESSIASVAVREAHAEVVTKNLEAVRSALEAGSTRLERQRKSFTAHLVAEEGNVAAGGSTRLERQRKSFTAHLPAEEGNVAAGDGIAAGIAAAVRADGLWGVFTSMACCSTKASR